jgi:hypothetical protein
MMAPVPFYIKDPKAKIVALGIQSGLMGIYGICMPIAGSINEFTKST